MDEKEKEEWKSAALRGPGEGSGEEDEEGAAVTKQGAAGAGSRERRGAGGAASLPLLVGDAAGAVHGGGMASPPAGSLEREAAAAPMAVAGRWRR